VKSNYSSKVGKIVRVLDEAKAQMIELSTESQSASDWDTAECLITWARSIDAIKQEMEGKTGKRGEIPSPPIPSTRLPYYYVDNGGIVMRGPSRNRDGGYYEHRIPKSDYNLIVQKLCEIAQSSHDFYTQDLQNRSEMAIHKPGEIVKLLAQKGLLTEVRKGRYGFVKAETFASDLAGVWSGLPRNPPIGDWQRRPGACPHFAAPP